MKVIYLRVSNDDLSYEDQLPEIISAFNLKKSEVSVFEEKVSAYKDKDQNKRIQFIKLKNLIEDGLVTDVYVYSLERFERNIQRMLEFFFFCESRGCKMHSALQPYLNNMFPNAIDKQLSKNPIYLFLKYLMALIYGFVAQNESFFTSMRTKKAIVKGEVTKSTYGNKWGDKLRNLAGERVDLPIKTVESINRRVVFLLGKKLIAKDVIKDIEKRFMVHLSEMTVSRIKKGIKNEINK